MKRKIAFIVVCVLLLSCVVLAENNLLYYTEMNWFSLEESENAPIPEGLTAREEEIYRAGYANGHYDALNPQFIEGLYVINTKTKKFHLSCCMTTLAIEIENREHSTKTPAQLMDEGYKPCGMCNPEREHTEFR